MKSKFTVVERVFLSVSWISAAAFVVLLVLARWPAWWKWVIFEDSPMTWFESMLLFSIAMVALACAAVAYIAGNKKHMMLWGIMGAGFFSLTLDERFALHERLRDGFLAPHNVKIPLFFWTAPGDFLLLLLLVIGLSLSCFYISILRIRKSALYFFIAGMCVAGSAVGIDSLDFHTMTVPFLRAEQFVEEMLETAAMLLFLNSFFLMLTHDFSHYFTYRSDKRMPIPDDLH